MTSWLIAVNRAIDGVMESDQKARSNRKALHASACYTWAGEQPDRQSSAVRVRQDSLQDIIEEIGEAKIDSTTPPLGS